MIELNKEITDAISLAVKAAGSQLAFERKTGIRQSTINKILNRKSNYIADRTWRDLLPFVRPYLPEGAESISPKLLEQSSFSSKTDDPSVPVENFRRKAINGVIDMEIDPVAKDVILKFLKNLI